MIVKSERLLLEEEKERLRADKNGLEIKLNPLRKIIRSKTIMTFNESSKVYSEFGVLKAQHTGLCSKIRSINRKLKKIKDEQEPKRLLVTK
jgi:hypothetical protein